MCLKLLEGVSARQRFDIVRASKSTKAVAALLAVRCGSTSEFKRLGNRSIVAPFRNAKFPQPPHRKQLFQVVLPRGVGENFDWGATLGDIQTSKRPAFCCSSSVSKPLIIRKLPSVLLPYFFVLQVF